MVTEIYASGVVSNIIFKKVAKDFNPMGGAKHTKLDYVDSIKILISLNMFGYDAPLSSNIVSSR